MFCTNCGQEMTGKFCAGCGASSGGTATQVAQPQPQPANPQTTNFNMQGSEFSYGDASLKGSLYTDIQIRGNDVSLSFRKKANQMPQTVVFNKTEIKSLRFGSKSYTNGLSVLRTLIALPLLFMGLVEPAFLAVGGALLIMSMMMSSRKVLIITLTNRRILFVPYKNLAQIKQLKAELERTV